MSIIIIIILAFFVVIFACICLAGFFLFNYLLNPHFKKLDLEKKGKDEGAEMEDGFPKDFLRSSPLRRDEYLINADGFKLYAACLPNINSHKWAVILHGYTSNCEYYAAYAEHYYNEGYSVLLPDARAHGKSEGKYMGLGWPDRLDVIEWCRHIIKQDSQAQIVLHGMSMGATTALLCAGEVLPPHIKSIISDSAYSSLRNLLLYQLHIPSHIIAATLLQCAGLFSKTKTGFSLWSDGDACMAVAHSKTPILFIQGTADNFVPVKMQEELFEACAADKTKLILKETPHIMGRYMQETLYWQTIDAFNAQYLITQ